MKYRNYLYSSTPSFSIVRLLLENREYLESGCHPLFFTALTRGEDDSSYYNVSYISDLGLRRTDEAKHYFFENAIPLLKKLGIDNASFAKVDATTKDILDDLKLELGSVEHYDFEKFILQNSDNPFLLSEVLSYYVDVLGGWQDADEFAHLAILHKNEFVKKDDTARLLSLCGNLLAQTGNTLCRDVYREAFDIWMDPYQKFTTQFRLSVAEIKRLNTPENIESSLLDTEKAAEAFGTVTRSKNTTRFCMGMIRNLHALHLLKSGEIEEAGKTINEAWELISSVSDDEIHIRPEISNRYRMQVLENKGLYFKTIGDWDSAVALLKDAVYFSEHHHRESLSEGLAMLGYALIRNKRFNEAVDILVRAEKLFARSVWSDKLKEIHKMLIATYDDLGNEERSDYWFKKLISSNKREES
ncbi:M48 family metallopeptidase [Thermoactinomyces sp. DSM 45892]|uniref:tetratricopeptide repeat protein n=1 Tax=Thermoactinomyces sp. DSM 45892 TaxID=1882753 RepID=UPI00089CFC4B|nr:hypothetical protein [Thermoactinomyces sp. DSM 45892]SDX97033.1 hypothetical protein SAMN05444416_101132 [Thermoactinomyces sp. DSM 45892]